MRPAAWEDDALCAQVGGVLFFPERGESQVMPRRICERCPVRQPCLNLALSMERGWSHKLRFGVWGGTSPQDREDMDRTVTVDTLEGDEDL